MFSATPRKNVLKNSVEKGEKAFFLSNYFPFFHNIFYSIKETIEPHLICNLQLISIRKSLPFIVL